MSISRTDTLKYASNLEKSNIATTNIKMLVLISQNGHTVSFTGPLVNVHYSQLSRWRDPFSTRSACHRFQWVLLRGGRMVYVIM